ncbi:MAG: 23S rRNA (guanosine(2251)-2'-O)-methyltransferase RlmB [Clostridia bacterium]|nr:23S rRNA (guanosine(2251)-2'-O)-methyltransferase RlmB [Clostridia bacterium]MBR0537975.1 23S rRNA (guanosine(2251)-2'-O)-methyltransferase RlmB [Clostridia bacterium]
MDFPEEKHDRREEAPREDLIIGRGAVREALKSGRPAHGLLVRKGEKTGALLPIIAQCKEMGIPVKEADQKKLDYMCGHQNHQGVILLAAAHEYATLEEILAAAEKKGEPPFLVLCDGIEDPHNLGAIIRSAEAGGAHGVVIPERRSTGLTGIIGKTSAGALEYMPVARVKNMTAAIRELQKKNIWVYAADMDGVPYEKADLGGAVAVVIGSEGKGVSRLVKETCDGSVSIPMHGRINSLNASVAAGILIFRIAACRTV